MRETPRSEAGIGGGERRKSWKAREGKEKASCGEATTQEESGGRGEARQTAMEGNQRGMGELAAPGRAYSEGSSSRSSAKNGCFASTAPSPSPRAPSPSLGGPGRVCAGGRHSPGRRGWNGNPPGWPRSARSRNSSSQPQPTRHYPTASDKKERDRQRERERERGRGRDRQREGKGEGGSAHAQIIIQLNKGFTDTRTRTRNSGRGNNPRGETERYGRGRVKNIFKKK